MTTAPSLGKGPMAMLATGNSGISSFMSALLGDGCVGTPIVCQGRAGGLRRLQVMQTSLQLFPPRGRPRRRQPRMSHSLQASKGLGRRRVFSSMVVAVHGRSLFFLSVEAITNRSEFFGTPSDRLCEVCA